MRTKNSQIALVSAVFVAALAGVWIASSAKTPARTPGAGSSADYLAPSGFSYPAPYSPVNFRSQMPVWELDGRKWDDMSPERQLRETLDREWEARASFLSLASDPSEIVERWMLSAHDPHEVIDPAGLREILTIAAAHARARSADTPSEFRALIEADPMLTWRDDFSGDVQLEVFCDFFPEAPFDPSKGHERLLRETWQELARHDHLFSEAGYGPHGAIFLVDRIRSPRLLHSMFHGAGAPEDVSNWMPTGSRAPMRFTTPTLTIDDAIARHGSVLVVHARIVTRLRDGRLGLWDPTWFYDPDSGRWVIESMGSCGMYTFMTIM